MNEPITPSITPAQAIGANIEALIKIREIENFEALNARMNDIGFGWHRRVIGRVLRGERNLRADELFGLAVILRTTVEQLVTPGLAERIHGKPLTAMYVRIGNLEEVPFQTIAALVRDPSLDEHPAREPLVSIDDDGTWHMPDDHGVSIVVENMVTQLRDWGYEAPPDADFDTVVALYGKAIGERMELS